MIIIHLRHLLAYGCHLLVNAFPTQALTSGWPGIAGYDITIPHTLAAKAKAAFDAKAAKAKEAADKKAAKTKAKVDKKEEKTKDEMKKDAMKK